MTRYCSLAGVKVAVLGASGFIGTRLVRRLTEERADVCAVDIVEPRERLPSVSYMQADVREPLRAEIAQGAKIIFNLAAVHRTPGHPPHEYYDTNVRGALNVTALAESSGVECVVFTSSISVYGACEQLRDEQSELNPRSDYGRSKKIAESVHQHWARRAPERRLIIVRPGVVFGPGERGNYTHLARALRRGVFFYPGRRDTIKSGGHVDELLRTLLFALRRPEREVLYNFAYPDPSTTEEIVRTFGAVGSFRDRCATLPTPLLIAAASVFEIANALGFRNPIHRERIEKLVISTRIEPRWLLDNGYMFSSDLRTALAAWRDETEGSFT